MREIKFRAWDSVDNKMIESNDIDSDMYFPSFDPHLSIGRYLENGDWEQDIPIMQYTGLKDKNGKEIYEGDIVRILYTDWPSKSCDDERTIGQYMNDIAKIGFVAWDDYSTGWAVRIKSKYSYDEDGRVNSSIVHGRHGFREVIGNIYQNPELL